MEGTKKIKMFLSFHIAFILIATAIFFIYNSPPTHEFKITYPPKEGLPIANILAKEWSDNASLYQVTAYPPYCHKIECWVFSYINTSDMSGELFDGLWIYVYPNGTAEEHIWPMSSTFYHPTHGESSILPFFNWTIDADEAISQLMDNEDFKEYLKDAPDPTLVSLCLLAHESDPNPIWYFEFEHRYQPMPGDIYDVGAWVYFDSSTGDIYRLYTYGHKPVPICPLTLYVIFIIINFGYITKIFKNRNNPPATP